jgi:RNA polymerase sigma-70 factor (ECF subfamily)
MFANSVFDMSIAVHGAAPASIPPAGNQAPLSMNEQASLIAAAQANPEAFAALYHRYYPVILRFARRRTRNTAQAEDVTAATFLAAWEALPRYEWRGIPFTAWLYRIAATIIAGEYRKQHGVSYVPLDDPLAPTQDIPSGDPDPEAWLEAREQREYARALIRRALPHLTAAQRQAVTLRYAGPEPLPLAEVARRMGRTEGAIKLLLHRAMGALRRALADIEHTEGPPPAGPNRVHPYHRAEDVKTIPYDTREAA